MPENVPVKNFLIKKIFPTSVFRNLKGSAASSSNEEIVGETEEENKTQPENESRD
jgi:hypothetical protein